MDFNHVSVLLNETVDGLNIKPDGVYVDGTLGGAGHSSEISKRLSGSGVLIGIDQDDDAIKTAKERLGKFDNVKYIVKDNYSNIDQILNDLKFDTVDGIMLDIGVSSYQLDEAERGFSYMQDAPLDMRMNRDNELSAENVVNDYSQEELKRIFKFYGEERFAGKIANLIIETREKTRIKTTLELVEIIKKAIPFHKPGSGHPAKRVFQAIRIEVNKELEVLENSIESMVNRLNKGGRLCIITFHSLEDRIVKQKFKELENPCICPREVPICICGKKPKIKIITRKPILPTEEEINQNSRSKSAKLRIVEKI